MEGGDEVSSLVSQLGSYLSSAAEYTSKPLESFLKGKADLIAVAQLYKNVLTLAKKQLLDDEAISALENSVKYIIGSLTKTDGTKSTISSSQDSNDLEEQLNSLRNELQREKDRNQQAQEKINALEDSQTKKVEEITKKNAEILDLQDQLNEKNNDIKLLNDQKQKQEQNFSNEQQERKELENEINALKEKLEKKRAIIQSLQQKVSEGRNLSYEVKEAQNQSMELSQRADDADKTRRAMLRLTTLNNDLTAEVTELRGKYKKSIDLLQRQGVLNEAFEQQIQTLEQQNNEHEGLIEDLRAELEEVGATADEAAQLEEDLDEARHQLAAITEALHPRYIAAPADVPDIITELIAGQNGAALVSESKLSSLDSTVDFLTNLVTGILKKGELAEEMLGRAVPIIDDSTIKLDVQLAIGEARKKISGYYIASKTQEDEIQSPIEKSIKESEEVEKSKEDCGLSDIDDQKPLSEEEEKTTAKLSAATVLAAIVRRLIKYTNVTFRELSRVKKDLLLVCTDAELGTKIADWVEETTKAIEELSIKGAQALHTPNDANIKSIAQFVDAAVSVIEMLNRELKPITGSGVSATPEQVISKAVEMIKGAEDRASEERQNLTTRFESKIKQLQKDLQEERLRYREADKEVQQKTFELNRSKREAETSLRENEELRANLEKVKSLLRDKKREATTLSLKTQSLQESLGSFQTEIERVEQLMRDRAKAQEERMARAVEAERSNNEQETERRVKKVQAEKAQLVEELAAKQERIKQLKAEVNKVKQVVQQIENEHRRQIADLVQERDSTMRLAEENDAICQERIQELVERNEELVLKNKELIRERQKQSPALSPAFRRDNSSQSPRSAYAQSTAAASVVSTPTRRSPSRLSAVSSTAAFSEEVPPDAENEEWRQWAADLVARRIVGTSRARTGAELRKKIGDFVFTASSQTRLIGLVETLRIQRALAAMPEVAACKAGSGGGSQSLSAVVFAVLAVTHARLASAPKRAAKSRRPSNSSRASSIVNI